MLAGVAVALSALGTTTVALSIAPSTASAGVSSDHSAISQLEQRIASQGARVQLLVSQYDSVDARMATIKHEIAKDHSILLGEVHAESGATLRLRRVAVDAYVSAASGSSTAFTSSSNASTLPEQEVYAGVASRSLDAAMTTLTADQHRTSVTSVALRSAETRTAATLRQLSSSRQAAESATASDDAYLSHVRANLRVLATAANERRQAAEEQQAEKAIAATSEQTSSQRGSTSTSPPPAPAVQASPGSYANPLRAAGGLSPERIDQGVDFSGFGPIYAIGDGVVLSTVNGGWPGGTFIAYRLTDGPAAGLVVYAAEDLNPSVQVGQSVSSGTVIGQMYEGPDGIETGWASAGTGATMASVYGQFDGETSTAFGYNFSQLLSSVGAPGGLLEGGPIGSLPAGWPQW